MDIILAKASKSLTEDTTFSNPLLIVDAYSKTPKLYGMKNITTEEVMEKLDMFQARFGIIDKFGWWDMKRIQNYAGTQFTYKDFQEFFYVHEVQLPLAAQYHQEMDFQVEMTWRKLRTISH